MKYRVAFSLALLTLASFTAQAKYDGEDRGKPVMPSTVNAKFVQECAGCHMAFPPGLLPAASWTKMMTGLDKHFDVDASVTPAEATEITNFLVKNASNRWTATTAPLRITDSVWFKTKHSSREVAPAVWKRASIKSASNCMACHTGAEKGDFNEHNIKIPK
jgi:nitrate/TMAO reductase-like tetraheme cytochrome c subunit